MHSARYCAEGSGLHIRFRQTMRIPSAAEARFHPAWPGTLPITGHEHNVMDLMDRRLSCDQCVLCNISIVVRVCIHLQTNIA